ncbi:MAG: P1 family peptidase, partial [Mycobacterium sp.]
GTTVESGTVGAGVGARAGALKGGLGTALVRLENGVTVGAIVAVNAAGNIADPTTGLPWSADQIARFGLGRPPQEQIEAYANLKKEEPPLNTTIAVVATDAALSPAGCRKVATAAHNGLAHTIRPAHTAVDGDTVFALATGTVHVDPDPEIPEQMSPETVLISQIGAAAADALATAVMVAVLSAESIAGIPTYRGVMSGAFAEAIT